MRRRQGYMLGSLGAAFAMLTFVAGLEAHVAMTPSGVERGAINRTIKGDRLPVIPGASGANPAALVPEPKLPDGCFANAGSAKNAFSAEVPGRCVAAAPAGRRFIS
jgi:hypothetical protein